MRLISLIAAFSISTAFAMPQHYTPWPPNGILYLQDCPGTCYPLVENGAMKDPAILDLKDVEIDNPERPIYQDEKPTLCDSEKSCQPPEDYCFGMDGFSTHVEMPSEGKDGVYLCRKQLGFEKMTEKRLVEDDAKKAAKEARIAQEAADRQAKASAQESRRQRLDVGVPANATTAQLRAIVADLVAEIRGE